jgi:GntR family transcriptional regulator, transcriptional repressor for pyruvate dehydrogenase complex
MSLNNRVDRRRLYQQIADDIERQILDGTLVPDTRLPGEHELAEQYGVSRNVIREALKRLKEHGLVVIRTGSGTYVSMPTTKTVSQALGRLLQHNLDDYSVSQFYEVRRMLEPECARLAAERGTPRDMDLLIRTLFRMEENQTDSVAWSNADLDFHLAVAETAHNPLVLSILKPLTDTLCKVIKVGYMDPQGTLAGLEAHRQILKSIQSQDPLLAHKAMLEHLIDSQMRVKKLGFH